VPDILPEIPVFHPELGRLEPFCLLGEELLHPLLRRVHLAGGTVDLHRAGPAPEEFVHRLPLLLAEDVPAGRFDPEVAPPQDARLLQQGLDAGDVRRIGPHEVSAEKVSQPLPFLPHRGAGGEPLDSLVRDDPDQRESVVRLRIAGDPGRPEGRPQGHRYMVQVKGFDFHLFLLQGDE